MATGGGSTGPFSHRVLLMLEEKEVPYRVEFVDVAHKPEGVSKVNPAGTLPILKDCGTGQYICDSDTISDYLIDKYPGGPDSGKRELKKVVDCPQPGPQLWPKFQAFLTAPGGSQEEEEAKQQLMEQLQIIEAAVPNSHPYVGGREVCAYDCALAPRLYLARQGCKALKGWDFCDDLPNTKAYLHRWSGRLSWRNSASWDDDVIAADLRRKMEQKKS